MGIFNIRCEKTHFIIKMFSGFKSQWMIRARRNTTSVSSTCLGKSHKQHLFSSEHKGQAEKIISRTYTNQGEKAFTLHTHTRTHPLTRVTMHEQTRKIIYTKCSHTDPRTSEPHPCRNKHAYIIAQAPTHIGNEVHHLALR